MKQIILIVLLGLSLPVKSDEMLNLNLIVAAINTLDLIQTRCTTKNTKKCCKVPEGKYCHETNPTMSKHPTYREINERFLLYEVGTIAISYGLAYFGKPKWGKNFLKCVIIGQGANVAKNFYIGFRLEFSIEDLK